MSEDDGFGPIKIGADNSALKHKLVFALNEATTTLSEQAITDEERETIRKFLSIAAVYMVLEEVFPSQKGLVPQGACVESMKSKGFFK
jgi:hypothetical protein